MPFATASRATDITVAVAAARTTQHAVLVTQVTRLPALASPFHSCRPTSVGGLAATARPPAPGECFSVARYFSLHHTTVSFVSSGIIVLPS